MPNLSSVGSTHDELRALTKQDVTDRLQISIRSVERLIEQGELKTVHPPKRGVPVRIPVGSLRAYLYGAV